MAVKFRIAMKCLMLDLLPDCLMKSGTGLANGYSTSISLFIWCT
uniref:Uncharacterized protein n=1 Tax=Anguilla anguilla TaxID=7936 RepID=A0A0E9RI80_ANGAN